MPMRPTPAATSELIPGIMVSWIAPAKRMR